MEEIPLSSLKPYNAATIVSAGKNGLAARLLDIGLTPGTAITRLFSAPCGDPTAYLVRGACIAVRRRDAEHITVRPMEGRIC